MVCSKRFTHACHTGADMRVADLRKELGDRSLDKTCNKTVLVVRFAKVCLSRRRVCVVLHSFCNFWSRHWLWRGNRVEGERYQALGSTKGEKPRQKREAKVRVIIRKFPDAVFEDREGTRLYRDEMWVFCG